MNYHETSHVSPVPMQNKNIDVNLKGYISSQSWEVSFIQIGKYYKFNTH